MSDGMTVSTTPLEWRSRVRAIAQSCPVVPREDDIGRRMLMLREKLKSPAHVGSKSPGRTKRSSLRQLVGQRSKKT